jgi:hypothetical protein
MSADNDYNLNIDREFLEKEYGFIKYKDKKYIKTELFQQGGSIDTVWTIDENNNCVEFSFEVTKPFVNFKGIVIEGEFDRDLSTAKIINGKSRYYG